MTCNRQMIYIYRGDDTDWNNEQFVTVYVTSSSSYIDLSTMSAVFTLGNFTQTYSLAEGSFMVSLSSEVTRQLPYGPLKGSIKILDSQNRIKTITTDILFYVTSHVIDEQNVDYNYTVSPNSPIEINVNIGGGSGRAEWGFIGGDILDQEDLQAEFATKQDVIEDLETIRSGAALGTTAVQPETLDNYATNSALQIGLASKQDNLNQAQLDATNSGIDSVKVGQITTNTSNITTIESKIPAQATAQNQLADKNFVNSSIATNTANFIGTFESLSDLEGYSGTVTNNDYAFVINSVITDNDSDWATFAALDVYDKTSLTNFDYAWVVNGSKFDLYRFNIVEQSWDLRAQDIHKDTSLLNTAYNRYKASVSESTVTWTFEYTLNNSSFTAAQWEAINSGITGTLVTQIGTNATNIGTLTTDKQSKTLATPITVEGTSQTTVESALGAINTLAGKGLQNQAAAGTYSVNILGNSGYASGNCATVLGIDARQRADSVAIGYAATATDSSATVVGRSARASEGSVAVGYLADAGGTGSVALGRSAVITISGGYSAIQIGQGTNTTKSTMQVWTYTLLNKTTGKIPNARLNLDSTLDTSSTNPVENQAVATALNSKLTYAMVIREW